MHNKDMLDFSSFSYGDRVNINDFVGCTFLEIKKIDDEAIIFKTENKKFYMFHNQECCEQVYISDIVGDLDILKNSPILKAEETSNSEYIEYGSLTWTFYNISTVKGTVTLTWRGESNGYYSESVDIYVKK
jgi:hypothetical protein